MTAEDSDLRDREDRLVREWLPAAAMYHFSTRLQGSDLQVPADADEIAAGADEAAARFVDRHGPPPGHFHSLARPRRVKELPLVPKTGGLYDALADRRTTRGFDPDRPLALEQLALLLYEVFGCRGYAVIHPDVVTLRKSSPSAGGLHPIEAYPLIRNVDGHFHFIAWGLGNPQNELESEFAHINLAFPFADEIEHGRLGGGSRRQRAQRQQKQSKTFHFNSGPRAR